jgi:hypothetical protein
MRTDNNRYNDRMNLKVTATVQGCVQRQVVMTNREEKDNGKKGENRSTRDVRSVDTGKSNAGKSMLFQEHSEELPYCLRLQSDGEGLEVPDDRDMDESSEGDKGRHGKRESSESQSCDDRVYTEGNFKNGANMARREKYES